MVPQNLFFINDMIEYYSCISMLKLFCLLVKL